MIKLVGSAILLLASVASAVTFIELNDTNRNKLPLEIGKGLDVIQEAIKIDYKYELMDDVKRFLDKCEYLNYYVPRASDSDWDGLAQQIKAIMSDPKVVEMCSIKAKDVEVFNLFDNKEVPMIYYKDRHLKEYIDLKEELYAKPQLAALLGRMCETRTHLMGEELLKLAPETTEILNGEKVSFLSSKYKTECAITKINPICKFVRRLPNENVQAIGRDFAEVKPILEAMDNIKLTEGEASYAKESGVSVADVQRNCKSLEGELMPFHKVDTFKNLGLLTEEQISAKCRADTKFNFYYQLYQMCNVLE